MLSKRRIRPPASVAPEASIYLTTAQVQARFGGVSAQWVYRAVRYHGFPAPVKLTGKLKFFRRAEVEAWEQSRRAAS